MRRLLLILICLCIVSEARASIAFVQSTNKDCGSVATCGLAYTSSVTSGDWLAVSIRIGGGAPSSLACSDNVNAGNWSQADSTVTLAGVGNLAVFYKENSGSGTPTVTCSYTSAATLRMQIFEYSGLASSSSFDTSAHNTGNNTSSLSTAGITPTAGLNELLFGAATNDNNNTYTWTAASSGGTWTIREHAPGSGTCHTQDCMMADDLIVASTAGSYDNNPTMGSAGAWIDIVAAFKASGGAAATCQKSGLLLVGVGC